jgi:hypothetical protein
MLSRQHRGRYLSRRLPISGKRIPRAIEQQRIDANGNYFDRGEPVQ